MERQLELRRRMLADGARPIGWKLGLGTPAAMEKHGTSAPLVGFLTDRGLLEAGAAIASATGASRPRSRRSPSTSPPTSRRRGPRAVAAAIGGLGVAIELVDLGGGEVEEILAGDIFHRHVMLGPAAASRPATCAAEIALRRRR